MRAFPVRHGGGCFWMRRGGGELLACLILCRADADVIRERLERRKGDVSDADWAIHGEMARRWEELGPETETVAQWVDTGEDGGRGGADGARRAAGVWGGGQRKSSG